MRYLELIFYLKSMRYDRAMIVLKKIVKINVEKMLLEFESLVRDDQKLKFKSLFMKTLKVVDKKFSDNITYKIFISQLNQIFDIEDEKVKFDVSRQWSLNEIREVIKSENNGKEHVKFWFDALHMRSNQKEATKFFESSLNFRRLEWIGVNLLYIIPYISDIDKKKSNKIIYEIKKLVKSDEIFDQYSILKFLRTNASNPLYINEIISNNRYNFSMNDLEKKFYKESLSSGKIINLSIYNLFEQGIIDIDMIWWKIL